MSRENSSGPTVSVIIPSYNTGRFITQALDSVIATGFRHLEIVVVEDGSTDNSGTIIATWRHAHPDVPFQFLTHPGQRNRGIGRTRNLGIKAARGLLIAFLDADDVFLPNRFNRCCDVLEQHPEWDCVWEPFEYAMVSGKRAESSTGKVPDSPSGRIVSNDFSQPGDRLLDTLHGKNPVHTAALTVRRSALLHAGLFPPLRYCLELALWYRLFGTARVGQAGTEPVARYTVHADSQISRHETKPDFAFDTIRALIHGYRWMRNRRDVPTLYTRALHDRLLGKWYDYNARVLDMPHQFWPDVARPTIVVACAMPSILLRPRFWKAAAVTGARHVKCRLQPAAKQSAVAPGESA